MKKPLQQGCAQKDPCKGVTDGPCFFPRGILVSCLAEMLIPSSSGCPASPSSPRASVGCRTFNDNSANEILGVSGCGWGHCQTPPVPVQLSILLFSLALAQSQFPQTSTRLKKKKKSVKVFLVFNHFFSLKRLYLLNQANYIFFF